MLGLTVRAAVEMLATAALVFAGCGAMMVEAVRPDSLGNHGIALVWGLTVAALAAITGPLSGGHFNPAVTVALTASRRFPVRDAAAYVPAQLLGGCLGATALALLQPSRPALLGATIPSIALAAAVVVEGLMTILLILVVRTVTADPRVGGLVGAVAVGCAVGLDSFLGGPLTGASMNPARSLGPAALSGVWDHLWIYVLGPIGGAVLGSTLFDVLRQRASLKR